MNQPINATFAALSDPTRRAMLQRLMWGPVSVATLAIPFSMSMQAVSKHIRVLERAGLVRKTKSGRERVIAIEAAPLQAADAWITEYRRLWEERSDVLEDC